MAKKIADKGATAAFLMANLSYDGDDCLLWPYAKKSKGYGLAVIGGVQKAASRWMCILTYGYPPDGKNHAAHSCGNPSCVNPRHLQWKTHAENMQDKNKHGTNIYGERNGKTRLTADDVRAIRAAPNDLAPLMKQYGMTRQGLVKIRSGARWGHIA
jgi:HNH endonuclease